MCQVLCRAPYGEPQVANAQKNLVPLYYIWKKLFIRKSFTTGDNKLPGLVTFLEW